MRLATRNVFFTAFVAMLVLAVVAFMSVGPVSAARSAWNINQETDLGELIVLGSVLDDGGDSLDLDGDSRLMELVVLSEIFGEGSFGLGSSGNSNLGELVIISELFNDDDEDGDEEALDQDDDEDDEDDRDLTELLLLSSVFRTDNGMMIIVEPGDTLSEIAVEFGTTVSALVALNDIDDPDLIFVGQRLQIPESSGTGFSSDFGDLILLDALFGDDDDGDDDDILDSDLGNLIILNQLFGNDNMDNGLF